MGRILSVDLHPATKIVIRSNKNNKQLILFFIIIFMGIKAFIYIQEFDIILELGSNTHTTFSEADWVME